MTGFPLLRFLVLAVLFGAAAVPLAWLTAERPDLKGAALSSAGKMEGGRGIPAVLRVRWSHAPESLMIRQGEEVWLEAGGAGGSPLERAVEIPENPDGFEVMVEAVWPEGTPETALEVEVEPDGLETRRSTVWSATGRLEELVLFRWE